MLLAAYRQHMLMQLVQAANCSKGSASGDLPLHIRLAASSGLAGNAVDATGYRLAAQHCQQLNTACLHGLDELKDARPIVRLLLILGRDELDQAMLLLIPRPVLR